MGRVHIPLGVLLIASSVFAADVPKVLFIGNSGGYSTRIVATNNSDSATSFTFKEIAPTATCFNVTESEPLAPHRAAVYGSNLVCDGIALISAPSNLDVKAIIDFKNQSSFVVPPIGAVTVDAPVVVGPVISDDEMSAYITGFAKEHTALTVEVFDTDPAFGGQPRGGDPEAFEASAGAFQYQLKAQGVVWLRVSLGYKQLGIVPSKAPVYGFLSNATSDNRNSIIFGF